MVFGVWLLFCFIMLCVGVVVVLVVVMLIGCGLGDFMVVKMLEVILFLLIVYLVLLSSELSLLFVIVVLFSNYSVVLVDLCVVNFVLFIIVKVVFEFFCDLCSEQFWNLELLVGNYNECVQLLVVVIKVNMNVGNLIICVVMFYFGKYILQGVFDIYGFIGIDILQCMGDMVVLMYVSGIGLNNVVKFCWNGGGVELIGNIIGG